MQIQQRHIVAAAVTIFLLVIVFSLMPKATDDNSKYNNHHQQQPQILNAKQCPPCPTTAVQQQQQQTFKSGSCPPVQECKCYSLTDAPPTEHGDGQVTMATTFGKALNKLAKQDDVNTVLEIGTWFGGGSTQCIAKGLKESGSHKRLYTLELYEPAWQYARKTYSHMPIYFILGGTVPTDKYLAPDEIPHKDDHFKLYYQRDIELSKKNIPWLMPLCLATRFDAVLIDGNEYTGWAEYEIVNDHCKPKYLMLHDVGTLKTNKIEKVIKQGGTVWELIDEGQDAARWQIYKRK
ncbi:glycosyl transferase [Naegleria gruberi]|uniref:Glycosyl transferase n=1 Tax=Naegleria gruberi TaxID=5762 RepID=D2V3V5_NAEGR|nr:glycosyl transferase [Naegleria gruberi]EFC48261.1 glycosyl transferase [Naegleria gruberi]|eukprot:XP_002681005.1 glycosyl transferase [Naegleria gruberi strain NEG-M]